MLTTKLETNGLRVEDKAGNSVALISFDAGSRLYNAYFSDQLFNEERAEIWNQSNGIAFRSLKAAEYYVLAAYIEETHPQSPNEAAWYE